MLFDEWKLENALVVEREEGREEGIEIGFGKGREEGREEGKYIVARNAFGKGASIEFISEITGLNTRTVQDIVNGF